MLAKLPVVKGVILSCKLSRLHVVEQEKFYNAQTRNLTRAEVVNEIVKSAIQVVGSSYDGAVESGFNDRKTDLKTRVSFKVLQPCKS